MQPQEPTKDAVSHKAPFEAPFNIHKSVELVDFYAHCAPQKSIVRTTSQRSGTDMQLLGSVAAQMTLDWHGVHQLERLGIFVCAIHVLCYQP